MTTREKRTAYHKAWRLANREKNREGTNAYAKEFRKTKKGLSSKIHGAQRQSSKTRNHPMPTYNLEQFREWLFSQPNFEVLYSNWIESDYDRWTIPSVDRVKEELPYSLDNIELMTWRENVDKQHQKVRDTQNKGCIHFDKHANAWIAKIHHKGKLTHVKRGKTKQIVVDALELFIEANK